MNFQKQREYQRDSFSGWKAIAWIVSTSLVWALLLAFGSWLQPTTTPTRILFILLPPIIFATIWLSLIIVRIKHR